MNKPYSESCDQNKDPILDVISAVLKSASSVLEIGSGTGQHAVYFAQNMPHLKWHTSDCLPYLDGINQWLRDAALENVLPPFELDVSASAWPQLDVDAVFTANSIHIMSQQDVVGFMRGVGQLLKPQGSLLIYGPFNYNGAYSSESNASFDQWLKARNSLSCIKDFEAMLVLASDNAMQLVADHSMPANNRILHFIKN